MGESFKFIHCSDLHLGSGFSGVTAVDPELGKKLRESVFKALNTIVTAAKKEKVDFVLFSGDIFDSLTETPYTRSRFADALASIKVPCLIIYGNHDSSRKWESSIPLPRNSYVFPETLTHKYLERSGNKFVEIVGASFDPDSPNTDPTVDASKESKLFAIGMFHCTVDGASDDNYAPCSLRSLVSKNIDYWALGHIHKGAIPNKDPYVVYPGNTQGLSRKESGDKGAYIVTVENDKVADIAFLHTGSVVWRDMDIDITDKKDLKSVSSEISERIPKNSLLSVTFTGRGDLDSIIRLEPESVRKTLSSGCGSRIVHMDIQCFPNIDLEARKDTGDFASAVINFGHRMEQYDREEIIDMICTTTTSQSLRYMYEGMSDDELRSIVRDSMLLIIEKIMEAER